MEQLNVAVSCTPYFALRKRNKSSHRLQCLKAADYITQDLELALYSTSYQQLNTASTLPTTTSQVREIQDVCQSYEDEAIPQCGLSSQVLRDDPGSHQGQEEGGEAQCVQARHPEVRD